MNIALVVAGGSGNRTGQDVPKQFLNVYDVPIFIYTLNNLEMLELIDEIFVVGPLGWENYIYSFAKQFGIKKLKQVITGGETRYRSIVNGLLVLRERTYDGEVVVVMVDANRPLIPHSVFRDCIECLSEGVCTEAFEPCFDSMYRCEDGVWVNKMEDRGLLFASQSPETAHLKDLLEVYECAEREKEVDLPAAALFLHYNKSVRRVPGSRKSMKITTIEDFEVFRALLGDFRLQELKV